MIGLEHTYTCENYKTFACSSINKYYHDLCVIFGINTTRDISKLFQITYNNFEISLAVFMPNVTTNHAITYTNIVNCVRGTRTQPLICVGCSVHYCIPCAINMGGFFEIAFVVVVDTCLPHFEALAYVLPHFDELTHVVIRASSSVC